MTASNTARPTQADLLKLGQRAFHSRDQLRFTADNLRCAAKLAKNMTIELGYEPRPEFVTEAALIGLIASIEGALATLSTAIHWVVKDDDTELLEDIIHPTATKHPEVESRTDDLVALWFRRMADAWNGGVIDVAFLDAISGAMARDGLPELTSGDTGQ
jgi:hypothetical protein